MLSDEQIKAVMGKDKQLCFFAKQLLIENDEKICKYLERQQFLLENASAIGTSHAYGLVGEIRTDIKHDKTDRIMPSDK